MNLKHYRQLNNLTQIELEKLSGVYRTTIIKIEYGQDVKVSTMKKLAEALNLTVQQLFFDELEVTN